MKGERGQVIALTVLAMPVLLAMAAFTLDVGSWLRADRQAQSIADAAVLAGAQALPDDPATASALARQYASKNGGSDATQTITFWSARIPNDTITVEIERRAPSFFAKIFGLDSVTVHARATARTGPMSAAKYVAPMVVHYEHPMLTGCGGPCYGPGHEVTIPLDDKGAPGAFGLINLGKETNPGTSTLATWIEYGYEGYLPLGDYFQRPGSSFTSSQVQEAMNDRLGTVLLFPVFDRLTAQGSTAKYHIIAWAGLRLTDWEAHGNQATITGYLTEAIWEGIQGTPGQPNFAVRDITLIE